MRRAPSLDHLLNCKSDQCCQTVQAQHNTVYHTEMTKLLTKLLIKLLNRPTAVVMRQKWISKVMGSVFPL